MNHQKVPTANDDGLWFYLLFLTGFFLLLEISFFTQCNKAYLADFSLFSQHFSIPVKVFAGIFYFVTVQLALHLSFCFLVWLIALSICDFLHIPTSQRAKVGIGLWLLAIITLLVANQYAFPNSNYAELVSMLLINRTVSHVALIFLLSLLTLSMLLGIMGAYFSKRKLVKYSVGILFFMTLSCVGLTYLKPIPVVQDAATESKPNIIIIGVDSLRPDFLSYFGREEETPFMDSFLKQSTVFAEALTPLARTFPSWTSILTGAYPKQAGVRFDLAPFDKVNFKDSLPAVLQQQGYETIFATDETRFSNIDERSGFHRIVTPPSGVNDFLVGTFNDFPLSNLLVNTSLGKWLFPYSYGNRPVFYTYEPNTFLKLVTPVFDHSRTKPLFLAIHFCLPHSPYLWAGMSDEKATVWERYQASILRVDQQLDDFFGLLKQYHVLDHAIVVMLSDHGEALEFTGDRLTTKELFVSTQKFTTLPRFYPPTLDTEAIDQSAGHGTDVLGLTQYHSLLAFRLYGVGEQTKRAVPGIVSLMSIKPTILDLLHIKSSESSLASVIKDNKAVVSSGHLFLESDFSPAAVRTVYPKIHQVLLEGVWLFRIDPVTTRLLVKENMGQIIIDSKQYADIYQHWMLAVYPQGDHEYITILVDLATGQWTDDLNSTFARRSPANAMLSALKGFYSAELKEAFFTPFMTVYFPKTKA